MVHNIVYAMVHFREIDLVTFIAEHISARLRMRDIYSCMHVCTCMYVYVHLYICVGHALGMLQAGLGMSNPLKGRVQTLVYSDCQLYNN